MTNAVESDEDAQFLNQLLSDFDLKTEYDKAKNPYKSNYPGGSSELTLVIDDSQESDFTIEELQIKVVYEVLN